MALIVEDKHVRYRDIANMFPIKDEFLGRQKLSVTGSFAPQSGGGYPWTVHDAAVTARIWSSWNKFSQPTYYIYLNSAS